MRKLSIAMLLTACEVHAVPPAESRAAPQPPIQEPPQEVYEATPPPALPPVPDVAPVAPEVAPSPKPEHPCADTFGARLHARVVATQGGVDVLDATADLA